MYNETKRKTQPRVQTPDTRAQLEVEDDLFCATKKLEENRNETRDAKKEM